MIGDNVIETNDNGMGCLPCTVQYVNDDCGPTLLPLLPPRKYGNDFSFHDFRGCVCNVYNHLMIDKELVLCFIKTVGFQNKPDSIGVGPTFVEKDC